MDKGAAYGIWFALLAICGLQASQCVYADAQTHALRDIAAAVREGR